MLSSNFYWNFVTVEFSGSMSCDGRKQRDTEKQVLLEASLGKEFFHLVPTTDFFFSIDTELETS